MDDTASNSSPNILLITCDDLTPRLGAFGDPLAITPNLDRLAEKGLCFSQHYTTCPLCSPARASLFTGLFPDQHGVTTLKHKIRDKFPDVRTWPQHLRESGYLTFRSGKIYHKGVPDCLTSLGDGDDDPLSWSAKRNPGGYELHSNGTYRNLTPWETHRAGTGGAIAWLKAEKGDEKQHDWKVATDIIEQIETHDSHQPALWAAGFIRPHVPLVVPKAYFDLYAEADISLPTGSPEATPLGPAHASTWASRFDISPEDRREAIRAYYAAISFIDAQVGRMLSALEAKGLSGNTIIIFTSDHGFQLGEHGLWFKNYLYRESVQVPLIIADPAFPKTHGKATDTLTLHEDLFPYFLERIPVEAPSNLTYQRHGSSLMKLFSDPCAELRAQIPAIVDYGSTIGRSLRSKDFLYLAWSGKEASEELYDLRQDPSESVNLLLSHPEHPALPEMRESFASMWVTFSDTRTEHL
jgi:uncharacterized sulfatase